METKKDTTAVKRVARSLRAECLAMNEGDLLGSEEDMLARYKVSRPTFRQAAALLVQDQLLIIRRGVGGGYFVVRPKAQVVTHSAAIYLQSRNTKLAEVFVAVQPIRVELARLAACCKSLSARSVAEAFLAAEEERNYAKLSADVYDVEEYKDFLKSEREFASVLARLAGNAVLSLFLDILIDFCANMPKSEDVYRARPSRVPLYCAFRTRILQAILAEDEELTVLNAQRAAALVTSWLNSDATTSETGSHTFGALANRETDTPRVTSRPTKKRLNGGSKQRPAKAHSTTR